MGKKPSIVLGQYVGAYCSNTALPNLAGLMSSLYESGEYGGYLYASSCRVDSNRNFLIHDFLHRTTGDFLFIFDEDMRHPGQMPSLLAARDKPIISGLYFKRSETGDYGPQFYRYMGEGPETRRGHGAAMNSFYRMMIPELIEFYNTCGEVPFDDGPMVLTDKHGGQMQSALLPIDGGGFGCLLIRRDALEAMEEPYLQDQPGLNGDLAFYKQARQKGIEIWGDASVIASHMQTLPIGVAAFSQYTFRWLQQVEEQRESPDQTLSLVAAAGPLKTANAALL